MDSMLGSRGPASVLQKLAVKEAEAEEDQGTSWKSTLLQALVQVWIVFVRTTTDFAVGSNFFLLTRVSQNILVRTFFR